MSSGFPALNRFSTWAESALGAYLHNLYHIRVKRWLFQRPEICLSHLQMYFTYRNFIWLQNRFFKQVVNALNSFYRLKYLLPGSPIGKKKIVYRRNRIFVLFFDNSTQDPQDMKTLKSFISCFAISIIFNHNHNEKSCLFLYSPFHIKVIFGVKIVFYF